MDPEPAAALRTSVPVDSTTRFSHQENSQGIDDEDPFSLNGPTISLLGITIAIATIGIPLAAVLTERQTGRESMVPTALKSDGSQPSSSISFTRASELGGGNTSRQQEQI